MKAFVEILSGVVCVGEDCDSYGKPYTHAVAFSSTDGKTAIVKALVSGGDVSLCATKAVIAALRDVGLDPDWDRIK